MASPQLAKAVLIPMNGDQPESDQNQYILVQFNPNSLKLGLSNTLKADSNGASSAAAQYIDKSESSMTVQLVFDTTVARDTSQEFKEPNSSEKKLDGTKDDDRTRTVSAKHAANSDVRLLTKAIADKFMEPPKAKSEGPSAPVRCRFQWGAFVFVGMLSSYDETLDFFSPEGIPLRATLSLTFKEDRYQFETLGTTAAEREQPDFSAAGESPADKDPKNWRDIALFNGIENPRVGVSAGLALPTIHAKSTLGFGVKARSLSAPSTRVHAQVGFSAGASASVGTDIPGAFGAGTVKAGARLAADLSTSAQHQTRGRNRD